MKGLKFGAICIIFLGVITTLFTTVQSGLSCLIPLVMGLSLIAEGVWILKTRRVDWLIYIGVSFIIIALLIIRLSVKDLVAGVGPEELSVHLIEFGVVLIISGWINIVRYKRFSNVPTMKPSDAINTTLINLVYGITRANIKQDQELIEFKTVEFSGRKSWKARLSGNSGIFVTGNEKNVVMERKSSIQIIPEGKFLPNAMTKMTVRMGEKTYNGTIDQENYAKYKAWKK